MQCNLADPDGPYFSSQGSSLTKQRWAAYQQLSASAFGGNANKALTPTTPTKSGAANSDSSYPMV